MTDDLDAPLGQARKPRRRVHLVRSLSAATAALLACALLLFGLWTLFADDPLGGEPKAVVSVQVTPPPPRPGGELAPPPARASAPATSAPAAAAGQPEGSPNVGEKALPPGTATVTIIDGKTGKREQVTIASEPEAAKLPPAEPALTETTRHGPIPKIGPDGARSAQVYAAPTAASAAAKVGPRIAIVVGRLGVSPNALTEALAKLPAPVTLAFTPYAGDVGRATARARNEGHEVLLQVPMEPLDYPENDPGPQTLLTSSSADQNTDRLHWAMSRFTGYVGISNFMGARFAANEQALGAVLREVGKRGLIFFDDGTSARALAAQIASANNVPFAKADVVIDAAPTVAETAGALARLETIARERGEAVGFATAVPVTIDRLAAWAKTAADRGFTLVPISVIANKPRSS